MPDPKTDKPSPDTAAPGQPDDTLLPELEAPEEQTVLENMVGEQVNGDGGRSIEAMLNVGLEVNIVLGRSRMPISQLLKLSRGSIIELDKRIGEPVDMIVSDRLVARGDLVRVGDNRVGVTLTEIVKDFVSDT
ncbi:Flagellar motor switch protein FliN [Oceanicola granulosus HTCC2516]|uniref:Flagellar motor switch protein FliN n=1 Tax=Oceanicola granulosus (strain ATCC BAA-861 / DSM 15982 / KCTC 12143 / HTCC2516) TaxID=314256 RepID=Q2CGH8_OCEGH|nr:Flagellar motor switch protein FliN [Oceanicola granulosus HTCC2516]